LKENNCLTNSDCAPSEADFLERLESLFGVLGVLVFDEGERALLGIKVSTGNIQVTKINW